MTSYLHNFIRLHTYISTNSECFIEQGTWIQELATGSHSTTHTENDKCSELLAGKVLDERQVQANTCVPYCLSNKTSFPILAWQPSNLSNFWTAQLKNNRDQLMVTVMMMMTKEIKTEMMATAALKTSEPF
jgi:hypothetical protein